MSGALVSFLAMAVSARELSAALGTFQILFFRSVIGLLVLALLLSRSGWHQLATASIGLRFARTHWRSTSPFQGEVRRSIRGKT